MKKYFYLQIKRIFKVFPFVLTVTLILFVGLASILAGMLYLQSESEDYRRFKVGIAGDTGDDYLQMLMSMVQTYDETRYAVEFFEMSEKDAEKNLANGELSAYIVIPEQFVENTLNGEMEPIKYITAPEAVGVASIVKNEITQLITDMFIYSEKGIYGLEDALTDNGLASGSYEYTNGLNVEYLDLIFQRSEFLQVQELGVSDGLSMTGHFICGIAILLLLLTGLPFAVVFIKKDFSLNRFLVSRGYSNFNQMLCEYTAHLLAMLLLAAVIFAALGICMPLLSDALGMDFSVEEGVFALLIKTIPVVVMISAFNIMIFEVSGSMVSGVLLHFFVSLCLCYISGCFYPIYAFPKTVQQQSLFLPTGIARSYLAGCMAGTELITEFVGVLVYAVVFFGAALAVRSHKTVSKRGWAV